ncbi:hypothetical protein QS306_08110 [Paraburkholderia bonniea]|uniref:hypothetical protein n=1 Tax=Paraburkholderia bonniea TaxID=2152891 RepID=UPI00257312A9|nr:hypothetical protein [Paraburkholderia bonniea]WJF89105.1 hypothetical protein QS306_08110 [Paraburkholderia bonniea]WJF92421.1 hypothetical protein QS308_08120 [Paraburkholderia bonniea]
MACYLPIYFYRGTLSGASPSAPAEIEQIPPGPAHTAGHAQAITAIKFKSGAASIDQNCPAKIVSALDTFYSALNFYQNIKPGKFQKLEMEFEFIARQISAMLLSEFNFSPWLIEKNLAAVTQELNHLTEKHPLPVTLELAPSYQIISRYLATTARKYQPMANGQYPLREFDGSNVPIYSIIRSDHYPAAFTDAVLEKIATLFKPETPQAIRLQLQTDKLEARELTAAMLSDDEQDLQHSLGVFATEAFEPDELIGLYTGFLVDEKLAMHIKDKSYNYACDINSAHFFQIKRSLIIGTGLTSRINSIFIKDSQGQRHQASDGYNVVAYTLQLLTQDQAIIEAPCFFAGPKGIAKGAELRVNYHYDAPVDFQALNGGHG